MVHGAGGAGCCAGENCGCWEGVEAVKAAPDRVSLVAGVGREGVFLCFGMTSGFCGVRSEFRTECSKIVPQLSFAGQNQQYKFVSLHWKFVICWFLHSRANFGLGA